MWKWSLLALGLGLLFAVLAWSGLRRRSSWRDGEKLWGQVAGVSVTPVWNGADSMDGDRSPARVTLRLSLEGREVSLQKDFPKVLAAPALGQRVQVLYRRSTGEWALWKDIRSWWVLWAILAATAVAVFLLLLLGGRTVAAQLSDYTVDHPNPAGSGVALLVGFGAGATGAALAWGLFLPVLRDAFRPLAWVARSLLGQWEPRQAKFVGWVHESDGDGGVRSYPLFSLGQGQDFFPAVTRQKRFAPGDHPHRLQEPQGPFLPGAGTPGLPAHPHRVAAGFLCGAVRPLPFGDGGLSVVDGRHRAGSLPVTGLSFASYHFLRS